MLTGNQKWRRGLVSGFVGSFAGSVEAALALIITQPDLFNLNEKLLSTLYSSSVIGILSGVRFAAAYLKEFPLPPDEEKGV
jgi:hypothetical protein